MYPEPIIIEPNQKSPEVILDKENNIFLIRGRSIVEDSKDFYAPIIEWLAAYFKSPNKQTGLVLNFDYLNSSSLIQITKIIALFEEQYNKSQNVMIVWQYEEGDELIENAGIELNLVTNIPFVIETFTPEEFEIFEFEY